MLLMDAPGVSRAEAHAETYKQKADAQRDAPGVSRGRFTSFAFL
jgi:hypothetical protein